VPVITKVVDLLIKDLPDNIVELRERFLRQLPSRLTETTHVILRILNCSSSVSLKKLSISRCKPVLPILNMLIIK